MEDNGKPTVIQNGPPMVMQNGQQMLMQNSQQMEMVIQNSQIVTPTTEDSIRFRSNKRIGNVNYIYDIMYGLL